MVESRRGHQWMSIAAVLVVILFLTSCGGDGTGYPIPGDPLSTESPSPPDEPTPTAEPSPTDEPSPTGEPSASPSPDENRTGQTWTVMLYFDLRDEITEKWSLFDVNEAESIGSNDRVRIVSQVARYSGGNTADGDWSGARRYLLQPDDDMEAIRSPLLADLGQVNMADEDTLVDFVQWSAQNYPADHYALVMLDHGAGWPGGYLDRDSGGIGRDNIALAEQRGDLLFTMEIGRALERLRQAGLPSLDLIGFDACLMASLEVFAEVAPYARYAVASQNVENSSTAWAYAAWLKDLKEDPDTYGNHPELLAISAVGHFVTDDRRFEDAYSLYAFGIMTDREQAIQFVRDGGSTLSAVDLAALPTVLERLNQLAEQLVNVDQSLVAKARQDALAFGTFFSKEAPPAYLDLVSFARLVKDSTGDAGVTQAADALVEAVQQAVVALSDGDAISVLGVAVGEPTTCGISLYFPVSEILADPTGDVRSYSFVAYRFGRTSNWVNYLFFHYTGQSLGPSEPVPDTYALTPPGKEELQLAPVQLSNETLTASTPVTLHSSIQGSRIGYVFFFAARYVESELKIHLVRSEFLPAPRTKEIGGVTVQDWGQGEVPISFAWDGKLPALVTDEQVLPANFAPERYAADPAQTLTSVEGTYRFADGWADLPASLVFRGNRLERVEVTGDETGQQMPAVVVSPVQGDTFTVAEQWMDLNAPPDQAKSLTLGGSIALGYAPLVRQQVSAEAGVYIVGFIAADWDGNLYVQTSAVLVP